MRMYNCIRWQVHPKHTEAEVATAVSVLSDISAKDWLPLSNYILQGLHSSSSWAHWACRVIERCPDADATAIVVARTLSLVKTKLSGPARREAPARWYREVHRMVDNPAFGKPGQKKRVRQVLGYVYGRGTCIRTFLPYDGSPPKGVPM